MTRDSLMDELAVVGLTVYMRADVAEVSRVLQVLVNQKMRVERFNANLGAFQAHHIGSLGSVTQPIMRLVIIGSVDGIHELERVIKVLNRLVDVYKVIAHSNL